MRRRRRSARGRGRGRLGHRDILFDGREGRTTRCRRRGSRSDRLESRKLGRGLGLVETERDRRERVLRSVWIAVEEAGLVGGSGGRFLHGELSGRGGERSFARRYAMLRFLCRRTREVESGELSELEGVDGVEVLCKSRGVRTTRSDGEQRRTH